MPDKTKPGLIVTGDPWNGYAVMYREAASDNLTRYLSSGGDDILTAVGHAFWLAEKLGIPRENINVDHGWMPMSAENQVYRALLDRAGYDTDKLRDYVEEDDSLLDGDLPMAVARIMQKILKNRRRFLK
jgi:hypothetical protein